MLDLNGAQVEQRGEFCRVFFLFLAYSLTKYVLADTLLADTDDKEEEDVNNKEEEDIDNKEEDVDNEEEDINNEEEENKDAIDNMPPKLKQAAVMPSKKTVKKELRVEKLATTVSKKLNIRHQRASSS
jgi:hypothetical protein